MQIIPSSSIPEVKLIRLKRHGDTRGFLVETYSRRDLLAAGISAEFVQDNQSFSAAKGVVRGLHFQAPPHAQAKLLRVMRGAILDVAVDIRVGSPTFGRHVTAVLSAEETSEIYIPEGFAHGFCTLQPGTEVLYKVSDYYAPSHECGIRWDDPALDIDWPVDPASAILSGRDRRHPVLAELPAFFEYETDRGFGVAS
ncbi:MAG TPA: dTDP-4-dehydrorhamnose 3,5-epimerase [Stellaceae bacterium]